MNHPGEIAYLADRSASLWPGQQRPARAPRIHGHGGGRGARERQRVGCTGCHGVAVFPGRGIYAAVDATRRRACLHDFWRQLQAAPTLFWPGLNGIRGIGRWACKRRPGPALPTPYRRPPQRAQCAGRHRLRAGRGRAAGGHQGGPGSVRAGQGPLARLWHRAGRPQPSPWWTTPTTPTPTRCVPPSTCWRSCPGRACWCWATWARWATRGPQFHAEVGEHARHAASSSCSRWASNPR
jgi:hypothetical protein